jgi:hypothetical protein
MNRLEFVACQSTAIKLWGLVMVYALTGSAFAQDGSSINRLIGAWNGKGKLFGAEAEFMMTWEWVLADKFAHLTFQNKIKRSSGEEQVFKARAFYKPEGEKQFQGTWFDSRGMVLPLQASAEDSALTTLWGSPETEQGRTVYRIIDRDTIEVNDFVLTKDGQWRNFGYAVYHRESQQIKPN